MRLVFNDCSMYYIWKLFAQMTIKNNECVLFLIIEV